MDTGTKLQASQVTTPRRRRLGARVRPRSRHAELDGPGMVRGVEGDGRPIGGIGQVFAMTMHADDLGDHRMINSITAYVPGAREGWAPRMDPTCELAENLGDLDVSGLTFTYDLREVDGGTEVTSTYEWTGVKDPRFEEMVPRVSQEQLAGTLDLRASGT